jgi:hypothetical protein
MTEHANLNIAVVGHTNVGKTSLLRTLLRDVNFGHIEDMPGSTRQVQGAAIMLGTQIALMLYDTPGIEDSIGLLDYLEQLKQDSQRLDGPDRIRLFLESPEATALYEQEARVLRKLLHCDAGLYVVDVREPVLSKHRDELAILSSCARPLLPILNFVASNTARTHDWRDALARVGLHTTLSFDSMSPPIDGEERLYQALSLLLSSYAPTLSALALETARQRQARHDASINLIADMLIDIAALRMRTNIDTDIDQKKISLQIRVREREQACVSALLNLFQFRQDDFLSSPLPLTEGRWNLDLFSPQALKHFGVHVSMGIAAGAAAGATIDVLSAGLSLGTGMAIGAIAGGAFKAIDRWGDRVIGKMRGFRELTVNQSILQLLVLRQMQLLQGLEQRGHATLSPLRLEHAPHLSLENSTLNKTIALARAHPDWSSISENFNHSPAREHALAALARGLSEKEETSTRVD